MPFANRIRLPLFASTAQFPTEATRFRKANGATKTLSVVIRKTYNITTDYMGELMHQKLVIALNHDIVTIEGDRYIGGIAVDGEYAIEWPELLDYPLGQAKVLVQATPFDATNSNCQTCDVLTQLSLEDDDFLEMDEGNTYTENVYVNDSICCFPSTSEIVSFNTGYLESATIDENGTVNLSVKNPVSSVGSIVMATYRVTCPDGTYDEADIYGSINGSEPACEQPSGFEPDAVTPGPPISVQVSWTDPAVAPSNGFYWELYVTSDPGTLLDSGTTSDHFVDLTPLNPGTSYTFYVRSQCDDGVNSPFTSHEFTTPDSGSETCGTFNVAADDGTLGSTIYFYSFMDCNGEIQNRAINNLSSVFECMLMDVDSQPVFFQEHADAVTYTYDSLC
jgi:hypothetical protein